jgi:hypothetical protein
MARSKHPYNAETADTICAYIRKGAFPHMAAEAAGVPAEVFHRWMAQGELQRAREPYRTFAKQVRQAVAQARILTEFEVREKDPRFWLLKGPGREQPGSPGWTRETKPLVIQDRRSINLLASPEWNSLWAIILQALGNFPEARLALADALRQQAPAVIPQQPAALMGRDRNIAE